MENTENMEKPDEALKKRIEQMLKAPKDQPLTIDKGHDAPIYAKDEERSPDDSRRKEKR